MHLCILETLRWKEFQLESLEKSLLNNYCLWNHKVINVTQMSPTLRMKEVPASTAVLLALSLFFFSDSIGPQALVFLSRFSTSRLVLDMLWLDQQNSLALMVWQWVTLFFMRREYWVSLLVWLSFPYNELLCCQRNETKPVTAMSYLILNAVILISVGFGSCYSYLQFRTMWHK